MGEMQAYKDATRSIDERVEDLLGRMTVAEKVGQMVQIDGRREPMAKVPDGRAGSVLHLLGEDLVALEQASRETRLGIPLIAGIDAIHGHALYQGATVFPTQLALSSSWDPSLLERVGRVTAREVRATGVHWTFSPVLCIARDLRWGRVGETFGEDPLLIGTLALGLVRGYQGEDLSKPDSILACAKHYAGYSQTQGGRDASEAGLTRREMLTVFLPAFEMVAKGGCATFMTGYEAIDGVPCTASRWLLTEVLKERWGFEGFVVTDWNNVGWMHTLQKTCATIDEAARVAVEAGNDMIMVTPAFYDAAVRAVTEGRLDEALVDRACRRMLRLKFALGLFDQEPAYDGGKVREMLRCSAHRESALEAAYESIVLLKNDADVLPLGPEVKRLAVLGPNADDLVAQLGDWSALTDPAGVPHQQPRDTVTTVLDGIRTRAGSAVAVEHCRGCDVIDPGVGDVAEAAGLAAKADVAVVVVGDTKALAGEGLDRANLDLTGGQQALLEAVHATGTPMVVVLVNTKPLTIPWVAAHAAAVVEAWNPGAEGGTAVAGILFGDRSPSGKLTISFPYHVGQQPVVYNRIEGWHGKSYVDMPAIGALYAFGYGLSYTTYAYDNVRIDKAEVTADETLRVSVDVTNTGDRWGVEIVQLYINDVCSSVTTASKQLKGFERVALDAGECKTVAFDMPVSDLWLINAELERVVEPGEFEVMVGASSRDADLLRVTATVVG